MGFAAKAGKLGFGFDSAVSAIKQSKARLVVISQEISPKSRKEIEFFATKAGIKSVVLTDVDNKTISAAVGKKCGIISINDIGFAEAIMRALIEGGNANDQ